MQKIAIIMLGKIDPKVSGVLVDKLHQTFPNGETNILDYYNLIKNESIEEILKSYTAAVVFADNSYTIFRALVYKPVWQHIVTKAVVFYSMDELPIAIQEEWGFFDNVVETVNELKGKFKNVRTSTKKNSGCGIPTVNKRKEDYNRKQNHTASLRRGFR